MNIKATIRGLSPLILNRFTEDAEIAVSSGTRVSIKANGELPREIAEKKRCSMEKPRAFSAMTQVRRWGSATSVRLAKGSLWSLFCYWLGYRQCKSNQEKIVNQIVATSSHVIYSFL